MTELEADRDRHPRMPDIPRRRGGARAWAPVAVVLLALAAEARAGGDGPGARRGFSAGPGEAPLVLAPSALGQSSSLDVYAVQRQRMVSQQILKRGIREERLIDAMNYVPRHEFVPREYRAKAYEDKPVPIDADTSISQPYIVALMTEALELGEKETVLEIGTGSGYHTAILSRLARRVYTIEIDPELGQKAKEKLRKFGYTNIEFRFGDGYAGWPSAAPFDAIIVNAAAPRIPQPLIDQLQVGGRMVVPLGQFLQDLVILEKEEDGSVRQQDVAPVRLPEMTGEVQGDQGAAADEPASRRRGSR